MSTTTCIGWLSISREVLIHRRMAIYFWGPCVPSRWLFISIGMRRNTGRHVRACVRATGKRPADRQSEREKYLQTIYAPMLRVLGYVLLASRAKNEWVSYRKCSVFIGSLCHVAGSKHDIFYVGQNQQRGRSWSHKACDFSVQRFLKLINLLTSPLFVSGTNESWILFSRIFCTTRSSTAI